MSYKTALEYLGAIDMLEARQNLTRLSIADFPKMVSESRQKLHKSISKIAYPEEEKTTVSFADFASKAKGIISGR